MLEPFNHTAHPLGAQSHTREGSNLLAAESLTEVKPEDCAVAVGVRSGEAALQVVVDFGQENIEAMVCSLPADP